MSEESVVVNKHVGYSFSLSIEKETRQESGTKYPDKTVISARLGGHADTWEEATAKLAEAKKHVREVLKE